MSYIIQLRTDTSVNWTSANPVLSAGEAGFESDTGTLKIGNGTSNWTGLPEIVGGSSSFNPPGVISQFAGSTAPAGYLLCDGAAVSRTTYSSLFATIGTTYGVGNNTTTFNLPNLQNRIPVGKGPDAEFDTLGETGGAKAVSLAATNIPAHSHTGTTDAETQEHTHGFGTSSDQGILNIHGAGSASVIAGGQGSGAGSGARTSYRSGGTNIAGATSYDAWVHTHSHSGTTGGRSATHNHTFTTSSVGGDGTGGVVAVNNLQPYIVVNYIIKT
jgi:microcystin-dependent protein